jgi:hypothetical protein
MSEKKYIYESPDGGTTVYAREIGETDMSKRTTINTSSSQSNTITVHGDLGVGSTGPNLGTISISDPGAISISDPHFSHSPHVNYQSDLPIIDVHAMANDIAMIKKQLAILEPNIKLNEKFEGLRQLYNEYKTMEKLLSGPDNYQEE